MTENHKQSVRQAAEFAMEALKKAGADMACVTAGCGVKREINVDGGEFSLMRTVFSRSLSLTGLQEQRRGSAALNRFDEESITAAAEDCLTSAASAEPDPAWDFAPGTEPMGLCSDCPEPDMDKFFFRIRELMDTLKKDHPLILMEQLIADHSSGYKVYLNSKGTDLWREKGAYTVSLMFSAHEGEESSSFFGCGVRLNNLDKPIMECGSIAADIAAVEKQIRTVTPEGKFTGTVVFTPECFGEILGTALGNFASDGNVIAGTALWKEKVGEKVADERLTLRSVPKADWVVCGELWCDGGYLAEDCDVIKDGILQTLAIGVYASNRTGKPRAKNSLDNFMVTPGTKSLEEIISGVSKGLLVARMSGGEPGANGDFSMVAKNSFLIENGKVGPAVSETMLSGNLAETLMNLRDLSKETVCDGGSCLPWAAFDGIVISGK